MTDPWDHLAKPFAPGRVIPYQTGYAFSFKSRDGEEYHNRNVTYVDVTQARQAMSDFLQKYNGKR